MSYVIRDPDCLKGIEVRLSADGGATFPYLLATDGGTGTISAFTVPDVSTKAAIVKITATDVFGNSSPDVSDTPFTIVGSAPLPQPTATLTTLSLQPSAVDGGQSVQAYLQLSAVAPTGGAVVTLASSNAAATVPSTVTIPAGSQSNIALVTTKPVTATTTATVTATYGGVSLRSTLTINASATSAPPPVTADKVSVTRAEYDASKKQLRIEASSTSVSATLKAYTTSTGALLGPLANNGGGKYSATLSATTSPGSVTVKSSLGGSATRTVALK